MRIAIGEFSWYATQLSVRALATAVGVLSERCEHSSGTTAPHATNMSRTCYEHVTSMIKNDFKIIATKGTSSFLKDNGIKCSYINKVHEGQPHIVDLIKNKKINLIINTTEGKQSIEESFSIRAEAVIANITYYTSLEAAAATIESFDFLDTITVNKLQNL